MNWPVIHRRKSNQEISTEKLGKNGEKKELVHRTLIFGIKRFDESLLIHQSMISDGLFSRSLQPLRSISL